MKPRNYELAVILKNDPRRLFSKIINDKRNQLREEILDKEIQDNLTSEVIEENES